MKSAKWPGILLVCVGLILGTVYSLQHSRGFAPQIERAAELTTVSFAVQKSTGEELDSAGADRSYVPEEPETLLVNINTADAAELDLLPGIGPAKAEAILEYRRTHGPFSSPEELMLVSGIKEGTFGKLENFVTVGVSVPLAGTQETADSGTVSGERTAGDEDRPGPEEARP